MTTPAVGDFSWMKSGMWRDAFEDAYEAITKADVWADMKADPGSGGFTFGGGEHMTRVRAHMNDRVGHSGASYGITMRQMQRLARLGWTDWVIAIRTEEAEHEKKEAERQKKLYEEAVARACFAAAGISDSSVKCPHGLPTFACMPCSH